MEKNDGLSEIICKRCLARLQIAYDFKKEAISSNRELRSFISDVNNKFKQVTSSSSGGGGSGSKVSKKRVRKESDRQPAGNESYDDELDDDILIQDLIADEYRELDEDEINKAIDRDRLVEILGDNSATVIQRKKSQIRTVKDDIDDEPPESMEVFLVDENSEVEPNFIVYDYEQLPNESITDESEEPQFLEDDDNDNDEQDEQDEDSQDGDENDDQLYEIVGAFFYLFSTI